MVLIFATNNAYKAEEVRAALGDAFTLRTMREAGLDLDIPEPHPTLLENALEKARVVARLTGQNAFAEDSGLEVRALNGEPGVRSARYAGEERSDAANTHKLLRAMEECVDRYASFRTVMGLVLDGKEHHFEGICPGHITLQPRGTGGFGYDPVFIPDGASVTFAEMSLEEKNKYSHRRKALDQLIEFLKTNEHGQD
jgi:XTP/dITP diphosphohydrolase